jgi:hypothetical protein
MSTAGGALDGDPVSAEKFVAAAFTSQCQRGDQHWLASLGMT